MKMMFYAKKSMFFEAKKFSLANLRILTDQSRGITDEIKPVQYTFDAKNCVATVESWSLF
jgi:hypothetical protein